MSTFTIDKENTNFLNALQNGLSENLLTWYFNEITNLKNKSDKRELQKKNNDLINNIKNELTKDIKKITITIE